MQRFTGKDAPQDQSRFKQALTRATVDVIVLLSVLSATGLMAQTHDRFFMSTGCVKSGSAVTGAFTLTATDGNNTPRTYLLQVPADYDPRRAYSLTFVFHGAGGNSDQSYSWGLQNAKGAAEDGIFVFPQGINFQNYGVGWDDTNRGYDMPFFDNMVHNIESDYCINTDKVFVAGFSWGGDFATALACNRGDTIRAVAANSTDDEYNDNTNYLTYQDLPCPAQEHPAIRFEHAVGGDPAYPAPDFATTSKLFQSFDQCGGTSRSVRSSTSMMSCVSYNGCAKEYIECSFNDSIGHALPPNWAQDTWNFFSSFQHERPVHEE